MFTPIAANTIAKLSSESSNTAFPGNLTRPACLQIWAAIYEIYKSQDKNYKIQGQQYYVIDLLHYVVNQQLKKLGFSALWQ